jgi:hypothetical protein
VKPKAVAEPDKRSAWLRKVDEECPYQVVLPRPQLTDDSEILDFLLAHVGWFDMYVEDDYAAFVRYPSLGSDDRYWVISTMISGTATKPQSAECSRSKQLALNLPPAADELPRSRFQITEVRSSRKTERIRSPTTIDHPPLARSLL